MKSVCKTCHAWRRLDRSYGWCCRDTPECGEKSAARWPKTHETDWCLEWAFPGAPANLEERVATLERKVARGDDLWRKGSSTWEMRPAPAGGVRGLEVDGIFFDDLETYKEALNADDEGREASETEQSEEGQGEGSGVSPEEPGSVARAPQESGASEGPRGDAEEGGQPEAESPVDLSGPFRSVTDGILLDPKTWKPYAK